jgi:hypothetical protein
MDEAPGTDIDPTQLSVGDLVVGWGHGRARTGIVISVGRKNAVAVYTTPGAVDETVRGAEQAAEMLRNVERHEANAAEQARRNYRFYESRLAEDQSWPSYYTPERINDEVEYARKWLAEGRDVETYAAEAGARQADAIRTRAEYHETTPLVERVLYTKMTLKPGKAKLVQSALDR